MPVTSHGWRPIFGHHPAAQRRDPAGEGERGEGPQQRPCRRLRAPDDAPQRRTRRARASPRRGRPSPGSAKNSGATGGTSGAKASMPLQLGVGIVLQDQARALRNLDREVVAPASPRWAPRTAPAARRFPVFQIASIAAIFAGWCSSVLSPCRSPTTTCSRREHRGDDDRRCAACAAPRHRPAPQQPPRRQPGDDERARSAREASIMWVKR